MAPRRENDVGVHFLHVGKTGGQTLKRMVRRNKVRTTLDGRSVVVHGHNIRLTDILAWDEANTGAFFLRQPLSRFVSGFNSRLHEGAGPTTIPWTAAEKLAFQYFPTPNDLAEALSSDEPLVEDRAFMAMEAILHTRMNLAYWFRSVGYLESRLDRIEFIGFLEHYDEDIVAFFGRLGVPAVVKVPHLHQATPTSSTTLSDLARENLGRWYADDIVIYEWALGQRGRWTA